MNIPSKIKEKRKALKWSQAELAHRCGWEQARISHYETGRRKPSFEDLETISKILLEPISYFVSDGSEHRNTEPTNDKQGSIPIISWVQAGDCNEAIDLNAVGVADDYAPRISGGNSVYGLRVRGNSMTAPEGSKPTFPEGYIIHVDPEQAANTNDYVIAKLNGEDLVTFKQLKQGDKPYLLPLNPDHKPIYDEFRILGKVIGVSLKL